MIQVLTCDLRFQLGSQRPVTGDDEVGGTAHGPQAGHHRNGPLGTLLTHEMSDEADQGHVWVHVRARRAARAADGLGRGSVNRSGRLEFGMSHTGLWNPRRRSSTRGRPSRRRDVDATATRPPPRSVEQGPTPPMGTPGSAARRGGAAGAARQHELRRRAPVGHHDIGGFLGHETPQQRRTRVNSARGTDLNRISQGHEPGLVAAIERGAEGHDAVVVATLGRARRPAPSPPARRRDDGSE